MEENNNNNNIVKKQVRVCESCGSKVEVEVGLNKGNIKKLFRKPTMSEWIELFIIIMVILSAFAYRADIANLKAFYEEGGMCNNLNNYTNYIPGESNQQLINLNISAGDLEGNCLEGGTCPP